jgi:hypothetical protein
VLAPDVLRLELPGSAGPLQVSLLDGEPAGVISTRTAGVVELEVTLEWPPQWRAETSVLDLLPAPGPGLYAALRESASEGLTTVSGELRCFEEEALRAAVEETLRTVASAAAVREAALRTRALRASRARFPSVAAVQLLARCLWKAGLRVGFGASWSPVAEYADVAVGCGGERERFEAVLSAPRVARVGAAG